MLTVWIPITKATTENGCLVVANKSHTNGLSLHCMRSEKRPQWKGIEIPPEYIKENKIPLEMQPGDVLLTLGAGYIVELSRKFAAEFRD